MRIAVLGAGAWGSALAISLSAPRTRCASGRGGARPARSIARDAFEPLPSRSRRSPTRCASSPTSPRRACGLRPRHRRDRHGGPARDGGGRRARIAPALDAPLGLQGIRAGHAEASARNRRGGPSGGRADRRAVRPELRARGGARAADRASSSPRATAAFAADAAAQLNSARLRIYSSARPRRRGAGRRGEERDRDRRGHLPTGSAWAATRAPRSSRAGSRRSCAWAWRMGGQPETFMGLTGLGDLVLTCTGRPLAQPRRGPAARQGPGARRHPARSWATWPRACSRPPRCATSRAARASRCRSRRPSAACSSRAGLPREAVRQLLARDPKAE